MSDYVVQKTPQQMVREFHEAFGAAIDQDPDPALLRLRRRLIEEETNEVLDELALGDIVGLAKELADLIYVVYGTAVSFGIDLDAALAAVHASNMSKLDDNGQPIYREDGKVLKGP